MLVTNVIKLKDGERVVRIVRASLFSRLPAFTLGVILILMPYFFMVPLFGFRPWGVRVFWFSVFTSWLFTAKEFFLWYWNALIVTTHRVIDVDQHQMFERNVTEAGYDKVQDMSYRTKGVIGSLANFGTLVVKTVGSATKLEFEGVRDPKGVHHVIAELVAAYRDANGRPTSKADVMSAVAAMDSSEARAFLNYLKEAVEDKEDEAEAE